MSVKIIVDSTADLTCDLKKQVSVVPLSVHFGDEEFVDGITITHEQFYAKLTGSKVLPRTSQPSPDAFARTYEQITADGSEAVVLTVAASLSGTYQSACIAAEDFPSVHVVDSNTVAIGTGILARLALQLAQQGLSAGEIAVRLEEEKSKVCVIAMVDTLEYLHKGGRLSKTAAIAGGLLNIKPIIAIRDGQIVVLGKARGTKQGYSLLNKEIGTTGGVDTDKPLLLGYTGIEDQLLNKYMEDCGDLWPADAPRTIIGSVIGTHAGPGAVAAAFFKK